MTVVRSLVISAAATLALVLSGCVSGGPVQPPPSASQPAAQQTYLSESQLDMVGGAVKRVEPYARSVCEQTLPRRDCDLTVALADESDRSINAYQVGDKPLVVFTQPMAATFRNEDEVAFVYAHEAAHYILQHGRKRQSRAVFGALLFGGIAMMQGSGSSGQNQSAGDWAEIGSHVASRIYSPEEELEADYLGAEIAEMAGFDPVVGVRIFDKTADGPRNQILPSHPPNRKRIEAIRARFE